ncbi:SLAIN motif-containing protein 1-like [Genypterus blacodes]|uniref:SLAIN motif-containing protein 1-like n=1 Tax=Genypterus blacodes TaxID=154954 RepID=UPI003F773AA6
MTIREREGGGRAQEVYGIIICSKLTSRFIRQEDNSNSYKSIWTEPERRSGRISPLLLMPDISDYLSHLPHCGMDATLSGNCQRESQEKLSVLDLVELLVIEDDIQDEESCVPLRLYKSTKKQIFVGKTKTSALQWSRHVLDNPSPEVEVARRVLQNTLAQSNRLRNPSAVDIMACKQEDKNTSTSCQSPNLARLHQQLVQFKLHKLAQKGASADSGSPLRTSLRSLQALRNSRHLEAKEGHNPVQITNQSGIRQEELAELADRQPLYASCSWTCFCYT